MLKANPESLKQHDTYKSHMFGVFSGSATLSLQELLGLSAGQLRLGMRLFDVVCLHWPSQKWCDAFLNLFHLYAIIHALRNAKMYNKSFF